jgi:uncharacterized protein
MSKHIKAFPFEMKLNKDKRTVEGYASTFGNRDLVGDIIEPGAFSKTITERGNKVKFLWQHNPYMPIGKPLRMSEDSKGLHVEAHLSKTQMGNDALALAEDGVIDSFSIGYDIMKDEYDTGSSSRYLKELKLYEFSLVTFPANEEAKVNGLKTYDDFTKFLKDTAGMDVTTLLKEGRTLNRANRQLIETAIKALQDVLDISEPSEKGTAPDTRQSEKPLLTIDGLEQKELAELLENFKTAK